MASVANSRSACVLGILALLNLTSSFSSVPLPKALQSTVSAIHSGRSLPLLEAEAGPSEVSAPAPVLDGKRVLPLKIMKAGLKGHKVAAVYALLNSDFKRGSEGWDCTEFVGVTMDLDATLKEDADTYDSSKMAHVRALSFAIPSKASMDDWAKKWKDLASEASGGTVNAADYLFDEDDDDDDEDDWEPDMLAAASSAASAALGNSEVIGKSDDVVSPFAEGEATKDAEGELSLTMENVDKVLDEVRPYLIADGGNVAVEGVEAEEGKVFLKLEGACGSCPSSTVTMSMGIERVLKENFSTFKEVVQIEDGPTELTLEAVQEEFGRLYPAIVAMGGVASVDEVDTELGVVRMTFRGSNKVRQGLELAILDIPLVNRVEFQMGEE